MTEPRMTREEWLAGQRAEWQASGTELDFEAWQALKLAESVEEAESRVQAEIVAERRERALQRLERQVPARYASAGLDPMESDAAKVLRWAAALVERDEVGQTSTGPSMLIAGPTGTGKTHALFAAVRRYVIDGGVRIPTCITAADLYARLRPKAGQDSEEAFNSFARCPLLAVDDLGAAKSSEWTDEINYRLLNHRYNAELPTLLTSNVRPALLSDVLGDRVASRLAEMCEVVVLKGEDRRRNRGAA